MTDTKEKPVVIVGAGVTGLSLAWLLSEQGIPSVVIEKEDRPGGLARSFQYDGFTFDIGPHRFHTDVPRINDFILDVLADGCIRIPRKSQVRFHGAFYPWPLHPSYTLLRFPPKLALSIMLDLFTLFRKKPVATFKDQIINMYGRTMYRQFFEGYSSKFLGIVPELTHPDWASTGIDRAIIDNRLQVHSLWQLLKNALAPKKIPGLAFVYPDGGCETFIQNLAARYQANGGEILCGKAVEQIESDGKEIQAVSVGDRRIEPSYLVWSGTVHSLMTGLKLPMPKLNYLALVCFNLMLTEGRRYNFQWSYHGASDVVFSRVSIPENFHPGNTPEGRRAMCVELTCREGDTTWNEPEKFLDRIITDLEREELLRTGGEVVAVKTEPIPGAYPVYRLDYRDMQKGVAKELAPYTNLIRAGRLGLFWYNNMDHCVEASLRMAEDIVKRLTGSGG